MSRGMAFTNPKEAALDTFFSVYDSGYIYFSTSATEIKRIYLEDLISLEQKKIADKLASITESFVTLVGTEIEKKSKSVVYGDILYIAASAFTKIIAVNLKTKEQYSILTPLNADKNNIVMNSNLFIELGNIWMITNYTEDQIDDEHKMFVYDIATKQWSYSTMTSIKKQTQPFRIFSSGGQYVYASCYTDFSIAYFDTSGVYQGKVNSNGYPATGINYLNNTSLIASYSGMLSVIDQTNTISHSYSTLIGCNSADDNLVTAGDDFVWFQTKSSYGRVQLSTKEVILYNKIEDKTNEISDLADKTSSLKEGDFTVVAENNKVYELNNGEFVQKYSYIGDHNILHSIVGETIDSNRIKLPWYAINNSDFTNIFITPRYDVTDQYGTRTVKSYVVLVGKMITVFDPDLIKFVFDKPYVFESGVGASGKAMITTSDTGYIGEFK